MNKFELGNPELAGSGGRGESVCTWTEYDEDTSIYDTECGQLFELIEGTPSENHMKYCCYCGRRIVEV